MKNQDFELTNDEKHLITALRFFDETWQYNAIFSNENMERRAAEKTSFLPAIKADSLMRVGHVIRAMAVMPAQAENVKVKFAAADVAQIEGLIYPNWIVNTESRNGSHTATLHFLLSDDVKITDLLRFTTARGVHDFIARTSSKKNNDSKRDIIHFLTLNHSMDHIRYLNKEDKKIVTDTIKRLKANPEAPIDFGYVMPHFRQP